MQGPMKTIILFFFLSLTALTVKGQEYRPLPTFDTDTVAYYRYNFIENKDRYVGQRFEKLLADYELGIFNSSLIETSPFIDPEAKRYLQGAVIMYYPDAGNRAKHFIMHLYFYIDEKIDAEPLNRSLEAHRYGKSFWWEFLKDYVIKEITVTERDHDFRRQYR
jgi:hypothetical protein